MNTLKKLITAFIFSTLGFAFTANATPFDMWDWEVDSYFSIFSPSGVTGSMDNHWWDAELEFPEDGAPSKLSWGDNNSSLTLGGDNGHFAGEDLANDVAALTASLTHHNFVIFDGELLTSATLSTKLQIAPADFPLGDFIPPLLFNIVFKETSNGAACSYGVDLEDFPEGLHCEDDIFVIDTFGVGLDFNPFTNTFNQQFGLLGYTYNIELSVDSLAGLADDVCARVGSDSGCIGITTHEGQDNTFNVHMKITQVPEPSTILLMSLALFGIVASMRNKHI